MIPQNEGRPQAVERQGTFADAQSGGLEHREHSPNGLPHQAEAEARSYERQALRRALASLGMSGVLALQEAALASHYAARSVVLMIGGGR